MGAGLAGAVGHAGQGVVGGQAARDARVDAEAGADGADGVVRDSCGGAGARQRGGGEGGVGVGGGEELAAGAAVAHGERHADARGAADGLVVLVRVDVRVCVPQLRRRRQGLVQVREGQRSALRTPPIQALAEKLQSIFAPARCGRGRRRR